MQELFLIVPQVFYVEVNAIVPKYSACIQKNCHFDVFYIFQLQLLAEFKQKNPGCCFCGF